MNQLQCKPKLQAFLQEEDGQTTTEYVLILAVILTIIMQFKKKLFAVITKLFDALGTKTEDVMVDL